MLIALLIILAYLIGSIPSGLIVGKLAKGIDIREHGSGNLGATNAVRTLGVKAGSVVIAGDILAGVFAVLGHVFPIFAKFKGGKAVATSGGVLLFYAPLLFITMVAVFFILLYLTKFVSLSSMLTGIYTVIYSFFVHDTYLLIVVTLLTIFVIYRHRANIKRIINKTEPKVKWL